MRTAAAKAGEYGVFHASEATFRGTLGYNGSKCVNLTLDSAVQNGDLTWIMVELFNCEGIETAPMRQHVPGYGTVTYVNIDQGVADGLVYTVSHLNTLVDANKLEAA